MVRAQPKQPRRRGKALKEQKRRLGAGKRQEKNKRRGKKRKEDKKARRDRRRRTPSVGDGDALDCCVLLTRLEEKRLLGKLKNAKGGKLRGTKDRRKNQSSTIKRRKPSVTNQQAAEPKPRQSEAVLTLAPTIQEHRRRRMASLNAEAVNSVLLYRDNYPASNLAKKQRHISQGLANSGLNKAVYTEEHTGEDTRDLIKGSQPNLSGRPRKRKETASVDWSALLTPTPKRQAGLTAATLLKLASLPYGKRRPRKTGSESQTSASQREATREQTAGEPAQTQKTTHPKREEQLGHGKQDVRDSVRSQLSSKKETFDRQDRWRGTSGLQECYNCGYQCRPLVGGFSLKSPKEEQETSLSPCYCCSHEMCVEYSHRLALFLKEKNFKESEDGSLSKVFHHHHHHHHHHHQHHLQSPHAIHSPSMSDAHYPHGYTCCPGYYVHFSHPDTPPSPIPPVSLCSSRGKSISGISHPLYCCTSMGSCYGEACRVNRYCAYNSGVPGVGRRACSFCDNDCTKCNHSIKNENFSPALNDHHSPSVPISPSPRTLTGCPVPTVPPAGQSVPHIQTPLSDPRRPQPPLQVAKECPQNAKAPSGSKSGAGSTGNVQSAVRHFIRDEKKKPASGNTRENTLDKTLLDKKNGRRKATNGWQPVGVPYQKKVFTVGEEEPVQRKCFEGVHRDGEVIRVRDTVLLRSGPRKKSLPYVAKISALWEDPESGEAMMSLFWYYRPEHTQGGHNPSMHCENEIFASRHQDVNSVACIEDKCYVLTLAQYCRFCALVKYHKEGIPNNTTSIVIPPTFTHTMPAHLRVPDDVDPLLVFVCRHVYDFRYGRLLKNLQ